MLGAHRMLRRAVRKHNTILSALSALSAIQDVLFHHGDTEGTEISQRRIGVLRASPCTPCLRGERAVKSRLLSDGNRCSIFACFYVRGEKHTCAGLLPVQKLSMVSE